MTCVELRSIEQPDPPNLTIDSSILGYANLPSLSSTFSLNLSGGLTHSFRSSYETLVQKTRVQVLVAGSIGSGKSSLINTVFGTTVAHCGVGMPITQKFAKYENNTLPLTLYDSKGLEANDSDVFQQEMRAFLNRNTVPIESDNYSLNKPNSNQTPNDERLHIDMIWYVVNSASRLQSYEKWLWANVFKDIPMIILLNKADLSTNNERNRLTLEIQQLQLPHIVGIFTTVSDGKNSLLRLSVCPTCESADIEIRVKQRNAKCNDCGLLCPLNSKGIDECVAHTVSFIPLIALNDFVVSQKEKLKYSESTSINIIKNITSPQFDSKESLNISSITIIPSLLRLGFLWEFHRYCPEFIAQLVCSCLSLFGHTIPPMACQLAIAIAWNRYLRQVFMHSFDCWVSSFANHTSVPLVTEQPKCLNSFSSIDVAAIESSIMEFGLNYVLAQETKDMNLK